MKILSSWTTGMHDKHRFTEEPCELKGSSTVLKTSQMRRLTGLVQQDQGGAATREEIRRRFGDNVTAIVDGCTDADTTPKPPWRQRKEAYIAHIATASPSVILVSAADKLHNARSILKDYRMLGEALWQRFQGGKEGTLWYYRSLVDAFNQTGNIAIAKELERVVTEIEVLAAK
ncbi:bifunctional (p)ppGpp synthetase/guanosine-3',5'-bis(diphosphate) 3'-pyrophosphohydrolase [Nostoc sp. CENA67]|uniref:Bifunctional (P)ppGpp synthetase/guanosine-3',5'-bis(Diphosphate) 3'-pyrophosphohydrolase n=1 Tax=Amazonocrinis nigriterrae CENA67 TaxID=2794033 RepID=A0A8J7HQU9_9NOST|nr:HD domain-containing protein [Amazonocrinis nigriterrae]MBH8563782.1 bifunctional (p)ppGpp synthetase/guanosine-3',5'-bis(diphosphate) 3'-pyrophosphohydrolase [Amazonocrinis nigriterrae CENA67]